MSLECVAVEILFQIPWTYLRLYNITVLRCLVFAAIFIMGMINIYTMFQLCMEVYQCVLSYSECVWVVIVPLWLAMAATMLHTIVLGEPLLAHHH